MASGIEMGCCTWGLPLRCLLLARDRLCAMPTQVGRGAAIDRRKNGIDGHYWLNVVKKQCPQPELPTKDGKQAMIPIAKRLPERSMGVDVFCGLL
jgi:hypothetical protein